MYINFIYTRVVYIELAEKTQNRFSAIVDHEVIGEFDKFNG